MKTDRDGTVALARASMLLEGAAGRPLVSTGVINE
jgi:hypothetical protein